MSARSTLSRSVGLCLGPGLSPAPICFIEAVKLLSGVARGQVLNTRQLVSSLPSRQLPSRGAFED